MDKIIQEWFIKAQSDLKEAEFLLRHNRSLENVAFFIHQAAEKYLKAFLIKHGWELEKIHDLEKLVKECVKMDKSFSKFAEPLRKITRFYFESRYPMGYEVKYSKEEIKDALNEIKKLTKLIKEKIK